MRVRRSPGFNAAVIAAIIAFFAIAGMIVWTMWSTEAASAADPGPADLSSLWGVAIIGGPVLLVGALIATKLLTRRTTRRRDPRTPSDDLPRGV